MKKFFMVAILACLGFAGSLWTNTAVAQNLPVDTAREITDEDGRQVKIRLSFGEAEATVIMDNHPACQDFLSLLPLTLTFEDYNGTENISYLPRKLKTQGSPSSCKPSVGTFAYYAPWGNLAIFYHDFRQSNGLVPLGQIVSGMEKLAGMHGDFSMRIEKVE